MWQAKGEGGLDITERVLRTKHTSEYISAKQVQLHKRLPTLMRLLLFSLLLVTTNYELYVVCPKPERYRDKA